MAGAYVVVLVVRSVAESIASITEARRWSEAGTARQPRQAEPPRPPRPSPKESPIPKAKKPPAPHAPAQPPRPPSKLSRMLKSLKGTVSHKGYDYWMHLALSEQEPEMKIEYLGKALKLNPTYAPAWGLKGNVLLGLGRYGEAKECFDRSAQVHPSALLSYRKGLCCFHLHDYREALDCFNKAIATCPKDDHQLFEDASRMRQSTECECQRRASV